MRGTQALDRYPVVVLDDLGYVQQDCAEMEVLFTFLAERYERRSVKISSHLVFSKWDQIYISINGEELLLRAAVA